MLGISLQFFMPFSIFYYFCREVLRCQPTDIYEFGSLYFDELVKQREETGEEDLAKLGAKLEDRFYNNTAFQVSVVFY